MRKPISKVTDVESAVAAIRSGDTVAICGTGPVLEPDLLLEGLEQRFLRDGTPGDLTVLTPMCVGDGHGHGGMSRLAHPGLLKMLVTSSLNVGRHPQLISILESGDCEGYAIGMGTMVQMFTAAGSGRPGVFTRAGLGTYLDPRIEGGALNSASTAPPVELTEVRGEEMLFYPAPDLDVTLIRATTADEQGYLTMEEEPNTLGVLEMALAAKARGGTVIAQVKYVASAGSLDPRLVRVPGPLVDYVVQHRGQTQLGRTMQSPDSSWDPRLVGALKDPILDFKPVTETASRALLRRAALELKSGDVVALGAGTPTNLPRIFHEEGCDDLVTFTNEHGIFGGLMATAVGGSFVPAVNPHAIMDSAFQFNFYEGGGLDVAMLGAGEIDRHGNVNVSKFGPIWTALGGFASITLSTPTIVFCGTFRSGGLEVGTDGNGLHVLKEGRRTRFVPEVQQLTFNARRAVAQGQVVRYVTERCVLEAREYGLELVEVAPGVDVEKDILSQLPFELAVADHLTITDSGVFASAPLDLAASLLKQPSKASK